MISKLTQKLKRTPLALTLMAGALSTGLATAQHLEFAADAAQRGYYDRPYLRYEAEQDMCMSYQGNMLEPMERYSQVQIQAEASRQSALQLTEDNDYVEWRCDADADGMTLRFSLPDSTDGTGTKCTLALYAGGNKITDITLDSYWAWQYTQIANTPEKYPDNTPSESKFARMRFDEVNVLLPRVLKKGEIFRLVRESGAGQPCTIDFVELEKVPSPVTFDDIAGEKVMYNPNDGSLQAVINANPGKTIYIPAGTYNIPRRLTVTAPGTHIVGAGMWHTTLNFTASSDNRSTYSQRGIESSSDALLFEGFSMTTTNNKRYFNNNSSFQVGKGFQGSLGHGSVIRDVRVDHFECGAWIADYSGNSSDGLLVEHCRFRNNYADGINLCSGTKNAIVRHCSFRNNGDDDMAIWSSGHEVAGNIYEYNTAENNWRASSLGIFGGKANKARNIYICDALEEGARINGEFVNTGYSTEGAVELTGITIERCGDRNGTVGEHGGFWGTACPSLEIRGGYYNDVVNVIISDISIINSRWRAIGISSNSGKAVRGLRLENIYVNGVDEYEYALYVDAAAVGDATYRDITADNCVSPAIGNGSGRFTLTELPSADISRVTTDESTACHDLLIHTIGSRNVYLSKRVSGMRKILK